MKLELEGKRAIVTGASRGIGRAIALALAEEGVDLALVATQRERVEEVAAACAEKGVRVFPHGLDVSEWDAVQSFAKEAVAELGGLDLLVNNAGITRDGLLMRMAEEDWDRVLAVNLKGPFNLTRACARTLLKNRGSSIVNVASVVGLMGNAGQANYAASKGGLIAFTRSAAREFAGRGVRVNAVAPGLIETDMTSDLPEGGRESMLQSIPLGKAGAPEDVARAVLFLASSAAAYVTGQVLVVDGGMLI